MVLIVTPIFLPIVTTQLGMDPIHFGIIIVLNLCVGLCTPPVGSVLFIGCSITKLKIEQVIKPLLPMFIIMIVYANRNTGIDTGYLMRKYAGLSLSDNASLEYLNVKQAHADFKNIRYAEVLLMMAETYAASGDVANTLLYINEVRRRVGMPDYLSINDVPINLMRGTTGNSLIDAVLLGRRYEFSGEAPHRFSDVWRYRLGDQVYGVVEDMPVDETIPGDLAGPKTTYANLSRDWDDKLYLLPK